MFTNGLRRICFMMYLTGVGGAGSQKGQGDVLQRFYHLFLWPSFWMWVSARGDVFAFLQD